MMKVRDENSVFLLVDTPIYREQTDKLFALYKKHLSKDIYNKLDTIGTDGYGSFVLEFVDGHGLTFDDDLAIALIEAGDELMCHILYINELVYELIEMEADTPSVLVEAYMSAIEEIGYPQDKQATIETFEYSGQEYIDAIEIAFAEVA